jgi:hypothetical protein
MKRYKEDPSAAHDRLRSAAFIERKSMTTDALIARFAENVAKLVCGCQLENKDLRNIAGDMDELRFRKYHVREIKPTGSNVSWPDRRPYVRKKRPTGSECAV